MRRSWIYSGLGSFLVTLVLLFTILFPVFDPKNSFASASSSTTKLATVTAVVDYASGTVTWSNPTYAKASDNSYSASTVIGTFTSEYLRCYGYNFSSVIAAGDTINGITVIINRKAQTAGIITDTVVSLGLAAGPVGNNKASGDTWDATEAYPSYGGASDTWGTSFTTANVISSDFGVYLAITSTSKSASVDCINITVSYTVAGWTNRVPTIGTPGPGNTTTNILLFNRTSAKVSDLDGNTTTVCLWYGTPFNSSSAPTTWTKAQQNNSHPANTTVRDMNSSWITTYGYKYWWKVTAKDSKGANQSAVYWLRTRFHNVTLSNPDPADIATGQAINPRLSITVASSMTKPMNVTFRTNASGSWATIGTNTSVTNGTYKQTPTTMTAYSHKYWWSVNSTGFAAKTWKNATYSFTTEVISTSVDAISPYETSTNPLTITTTASSDLSNVSLYYLYSSDNITNKFEKDVFRDGVDTTMLNYPNSEIIIDGIAYLTSYLDDSIVIVNATNPSNLLLMSSIGGSGVNSTLDVCHDGYPTSDGKWLYTCQFKSGGVLGMWDVDPPTDTPVMVNHTDLTGRTAYYLYVYGNYLFVSTDINIMVYNITKRNTTYQLQWLENIVPAAINATTQCWHMIVYGQTLYLGMVGYTATRYYGGLVIYNISNINSPQYKGVLNSSKYFGYEPRLCTINGFNYMFSGCMEKAYTGAAYYDRTYINVYNMSAVGSTYDNPTIIKVFQTFIDGTSDQIGTNIAVKNGYVTGMLYDGNNTHYNGIVVWNFTNVQSPTFYTWRLGSGSPNYLNFPHYIKYDENGSDRTIYIVTQNDDCFDTFGPIWNEDIERFGTPDTTYPFSFSFTFPNGTGYYEFYSIGQKVGSIAESAPAPATNDAMCNYTVGLTKAWYTIQTVTGSILNTTSWTTKQTVIGVILNIPFWATTQTISGTILNVSGFKTIQTIAGTVLDATRWTTKQTIDGLISNTTIWKTKQTITGTIINTSVVTLDITYPFPVNKSKTVLTGIGNISAIITASSWNISLRDNTTYTLQAYASGGASSGIQYCNISSALYFEFSKDFTWYVNATDGVGSWINKTYYFRTFNGSGFLHVEDISLKNYDYSNTNVANDGKYIYVVYGDSDTYYNISAVSFKNETFSVLDTYQLEGDATSLSVNETYVFTYGGTGGITVFTFNENGTEKFWNKVHVGGGGTYNAKSGDICGSYIFSGQYGGLQVLTFDGSSFTSKDIVNHGLGNCYDVKVDYKEDLGYYYVYGAYGANGIAAYTFDENGTEDLWFKDSYIAGVSVQSRSIFVDEHGYIYESTQSATIGINVYSFDGSDLTLQYNHKRGISYYDVTGKKSDTVIFTSDYTTGTTTYIFEGGSDFVFQDTIDNGGTYKDGTMFNNYIIYGMGESDLKAYGYELFRAAPPVIDIIYAGNPSKDSVDRVGTIRYVNQSYNNETFCNITANISVPDYRALGRYFRTTDDTLLVATGNLSDGDVDKYNYGGVFYDGDETNHTFLASQYLCTYTGKYSQISAWIAFCGHNTANISYAIYSDDNGEPGDLLGYTEGKTPGEESGASYEPNVNHIWYTLNISYDVSGNPVDYITLNQGTDYWLVVATHDNGGWIQDVYWILGNSLGDTGHVRNARYNISADMNFSTVGALNWGTGWTEGAHYLCIYAVANSSNNDIETIDIASAVLQFYNGTWENHTMHSMGETLWTVNLTGLVDDSIWHTFNITAYDELNDEVEYNHYRLLYRGWDNGYDAESIVFKTGVPVATESDHLGYSKSNVSTDLYNSNYVLYLYEHFYDDTPSFFGDGEQNEHVLPHEQGVDGGANDTGKWINKLPDDNLQQRYCYAFSGGFWDANISIEDTITLNNVYIHWWTGLSGHTVDWNMDAIDFGRSNTTYDPTWLDIIGGDYYMGNFPTNSTTKETAIITEKDIDTNDYTERLICLYYNMSDTLDSTVFDGGSIYQFFIGESDNQTYPPWEMNFKSAIYNNRSYLSYVIFNVPPLVLSGVDTRDSDGDTLSDWYEMNVSFTHPFLMDTDGDGVNDNIDTHPNDYLDLPIWNTIQTINGNIQNTSVVGWNTIQTINGNILNTTSWKTKQTIIGSIQNITGFRTAQIINGILSNSTQFKTVQTIVGSIQNSTTWKTTQTITGDIHNILFWSTVQTLTGSINNVSNWRTTQMIIGNVLNLTSWKTSQMINGAILNISAWRTTQTITGTILNSTRWVTIQTISGNIINISGFKTVQTISGAILNTTAFKTTQTLTGTVLNTTGFKTVQTINGAIQNTSRWNTVQTLNGNIQNISVTHWYTTQTITGEMQNTTQWHTTQMTTGTINNILFWNTVQTLTGSIQNISGFRTVQTINGIIQNVTGFKTIQTIDGDILNTTSWRTRQTINGIILNATTWRTTQTINGIIQNISVTNWYTTQTINGTILNTTAFKTTQTINGVILNIPVWSTTQTISGAILNISGFKTIQTIQGVIQNTTTWKTSQMLNGTILNISALNWYTTQTIDGEITNTSISGWSTMQTITGEILNTSGWRTTQILNGTIQNISATNWTTIQMINGIIFNISNQPPVFTAENPVNNTMNTEITNVLWNLTIEDPEGDMFNWTLECQGWTIANDNYDSANTETNGSKEVHIGFQLGEPLAYSTTYRVYVNATDNSSDPTAWTRAWYQFTTKAFVPPPNNPPNTPSNPDPANHAIGVNINKNLGWTGGDPDGDTVTYDVYFGTTITPPKLSGNQSGVTYDPGTMIYNETYYWKINAWDEHGAKTTGSLWDFNTTRWYTRQTINGIIMNTSLINISILSYQPLDNVSDVCPCEVMCVWINATDRVNMTVYRKSESELVYYLVANYTNITAGEYCFPIEGHVSGGILIPFYFNETYEWYAYIEYYNDTTVNYTSPVYNFTTEDNPDLCGAGGGGFAVPSGAVFGILGLFGIFGIVGFIMAFRMRKRKKNRNE